MLIIWVWWCSLLEIVIKLLEKVRHLKETLKCFDIFKKYLTCSESEVCRFAC